MLINKYLDKRQNSFVSIYNSEKFIQSGKNLRPTSFPFLVDVELTNHCNLSCIFCGQQAMKRPKGYMNENVFKRIIDECAQYDAGIRFIRYGEPFLHKNIIEYCRYVKSKGLLLHITNNGIIITEEHMKSIVDIGVDSIIFSFQGLTKDEYEGLRNNKQYDLLVENIIKLVKIRGEKEKPYIHISTTITDETDEQVNEFKKHWENIVDSVGIGKTNLSYLSEHQIKSFEVLNKLELIKKRETIKKVYRPCSEIYQKLSVDWDGNITCCCSDFDNFMTLANINDTTLYEIWNNSKKLKLIREMLDKNMHYTFALCRGCYAVYDEF